MIIWTKLSGAMQATDPINKKFIQTVSIEIKQGYVASGDIYLETGVIYNNALASIFRNIDDNQEYFVLFDIFEINVALMIIV